MGYNLKEIFDCFCADGTFLIGEPYGSGHIHDTFRIETVEKENDNYILQRLNNKIFKTFLNFNTISRGLQFISEIN